MKSRNTHLNLTKMAKKMMKAPSDINPGTPLLTDMGVRALGETNDELEARILESLRSERLRLSDAEFRHQYARWL